MCSRPMYTARQRNFEHAWRVCTLPVNTGDVHGPYTVINFLTRVRKRYDFTRCYTGWPKKFGTIILYALTLPNISRFSKLFHYQNQEKICNNTFTEDPTTPQVCRYTTLWNVKCLKSNNWKQDDL